MLNHQQSQGHTSQAERPHLVGFHVIKTNKNVSHACGMPHPKSGWRSTWRWRSHKRSGHTSRNGIRPSRGRTFYRTPCVRHTAGKPHGRHQSVTFPAGWQGRRTGRWPKGLECPLPRMAAGGDGGPALWPCLTPLPAWKKLTRCCWVDMSLATQCSPGAREAHVWNPVSS